MKRLEEINKMVLTRTEGEVNAATLVLQLTTCRDSVESDVRFLHVGKSIDTEPALHTFILY